ncbi:MAG: hypothetical protein G01um101448_1154, partial [Parcubacteria group bacterium Gr01-1014_48]
MRIMVCLCIIWPTMTLSGCSAMRTTMIPTGIAESCEEVHAKLLTIDSSGSALTEKMISDTLRHDEKVSDVFKTMNIHAVVEGDRRLAIVYGKTRLPDDLIQKIEHLDVYEIFCIDEDTSL